MDTGHVSRPTTYVVAYDLPADHRRKRFYRAVRKYLATQGDEETGWSTYSVVFTRDREFAWFIYHQALKVGGRANVYEARKLDPLDLAGS